MSGRRGGEVVGDAGGGVFVRAGGRETSSAVVRVGGEELEGESDVVQNHASLKVEERRKVRQTGYHLTLALRPVYNRVLRRSGFPIQIYSYESDSCLVTIEPIQQQRSKTSGSKIEAKVMSWTLELQGGRRPNASKRVLWRALGRCSLIDHS